MALSPTLAGFSGLSSGNLAGEELHRFFLQFWEDDVPQRPQMLGFYALRRTQLVWLMQKFNIDPAGTTAQKDLVRICEVSWMQGKFPKPPAPEDLGAIVRRLSAQVAELEAAKVAPAPAAESAVTRVSFRPLAAPAAEPEAAPRVTPYSGLSWDQVKDLARTIKGFKMHGKKREAIEDALDIEGVEIPPQWLDEPADPTMPG